MTERRRITRYQFRVMGTLHPVGGRVGANVIVRDISTLGCALERSPGLSIGENCELYFDWQGRSLGLPAQVVWKDAQGRMGLKFLAPDRDSQGRLRELCAALRSQPVVVPLPKAADPYQAAPVSGPVERAAGSGVQPGAASLLPFKPGPNRNHRHLPRYVCELRGLLSIPATGGSVKVTVVDLSISGGRVEGAGLPAAGQTCGLEVEWEGRHLALQIKIAWKEKDQAGVEFSSLDDAAEKLLKQICANSRLLPPAPSSLSA